MSKKSRKRNRRLLKAAALIGGLAMMGRRGKGAVSTAGQPVGVDRISTNNPPILGTDHIKKVVEPVTGVVKPKAPATNTGGSISRHTGIQIGPSGQKISAANAVRPQAVYAQKMRNRVTGVDAPPSILNPYAPPRVHRKRGQSFSTGGRVKGGGKAKRGLGRAFTKAKK